MKKAFLIIGGLFISVYTFAQMDNLVNVSANWVASPARNAATNATDAVIYNPASTASMNEGVHINIGNQSLFRSPSHTYDLGMGTTTRRQDGSDPVLPNVYAAYTKTNWSVYGGFFVSGGGATLNYPEGSITTDMVGVGSMMATMGAYNAADAQYMKASSYYMTSTIGFAYKINSVFSASLGMRYLNGKNKTEAGVTLTASPFDFPDMPLALEFEEKASSLNMVAGVSIRPSERLAATVRYESKASMNFKTKLIHDDFGFITDGDKNHRDLPSMVAFGVLLGASEKVNILADVNYYMQEGADWGETTNANGETISLSKAAGNAISYCMAVDFNVTDKFTFSFGGGYSDFMFNDIDAYYTHAGAFETVPNDNINLNLGASFQLVKQLKLTAGFMRTAWAQDTKVKALAISPDTEVTMNNAMNVIAIGADINF